MAFQRGVSGKVKLDMAKGYFDQGKVREIEKSYEAALYLYERAFDHYNQYIQILESKSNNDKDNESNKDVYDNRMDILDRRIDILKKLGKSEDAQYLQNLKKELSKKLVPQEFNLKNEQTNAKEFGDVRFETKVFQFGDNESSGKKPDAKGNTEEEFKFDTSFQSDMFTQGRAKSKKDDKRQASKQKYKFA
jgi:hypothetical protein